MDYRTRMKRAVLAALCVHVVVLMLPTGWAGTKRVIGAVRAREPIVVSLQQPEAPMHLVDPVAPAERPIDPDTDRIAERDSAAAAAAPGNDHGAAPQFEKASEFDQVPHAPSMEEAPVETIADAQQPPPEPAEGVFVPPQQPNTVQALPVEPRAEAAAQPPDEADNGQFQVAKAEPFMEVASDPRAAEARADKGAETKGFISFEAKQHEFAAYLNQIRNSVEPRWRMMYQTRYSGVSPTKAVLRCEINPQGRLTAVDIVEPGDSPSFAPLCREAIQKAAPFPPFPFDVPNVYRNKNLEIRWTFSFMQR